MTGRDQVRTGSPPYTGRSPELYYIKERDIIESISSIVNMAQKAMQSGFSLSRAVGKLKGAISSNVSEDTSPKEEEEDEFSSTDKDGVDGDMSSHFDEAFWVGFIFSGVHW